MKDLVFHDPRDVLDLFERECSDFPAAKVFEVLRRKKVLRFDAVEGYSLPQAWQEHTKQVRAIYSCAS
jgi:hypothetical protein